MQCLLNGSEDVLEMMSPPPRSRRTWLIDWLISPDVVIASEDVLEDVSTPKVQENLIDLLIDWLVDLDVVLGQRMCWEDVSTSKV